MVTPSINIGGLKLFSDGKGRDSDTSDKTVIDKLERKNITIKIFRPDVKLNLYQKYLFLFLL
jgi:hypothetical protein